MERFEGAYARARRLAQPMALMITIWFDALCRIRHGDADGVARLAEEMRTLVEEFSLTQGSAAHQWFRGWADAGTGRGRESFRNIREAYDRNRAIGMIAGGRRRSGTRPKRCSGGRLACSTEQLEQALAIVSDFGERICLPKLRLIEGAHRAGARSSLQRRRLRPGAPFSRLANRARGGWSCLRWYRSASVERHPTGSATCWPQLVDQLADADDTAELARARALLAGTSPA